MGSHATMSEDGLVVVPEDVRQALGLKPGDVVEFTVQADGKVVLGSVSEPRAEVAPTKKRGTGLLGLAGAFKEFGPLPRRDEIHRMIGEEILKKGRS